MKAKKVVIRKHVRKGGKKKHTVKKHTRRIRKLGKKIKYTKVGTYFVAHDDQGNFRGSKVIPLKKKKTSVKRRRREENSIHTAFFRGEIKTKREYLQRLKKSRRN